MPKIKQKYIIISIVVLSVIILSLLSVYLFISRNKIPDDNVFLEGFPDTGLEWVEGNNTYHVDPEKNTLCELRKSYCRRVGYEPVGCKCNSYKYYDSYNTYTDNAGKFTVYYPTLWDKESSTSNYPYVDKPEVVLKRQGTSCVLTYGLVDKERLQSVENSSTTKENYGSSRGVVEDSHRLSTKITIPFGRDLTDEEKAAGYTDTKLIAIPNFPYPSSQFGFVLTSGDKQPLMEACVDELDKIIESKSLNYPSVTLSDKSTGFLLLQGFSSSFEKSTETPQKPTLLFEDSSTGEEGIVYGPFSNEEVISNIFLSGGKLYYMEPSIVTYSFEESSGKNQVIKSVDIFTGEIETIPLPYDDEKPIHSFFVKDDMLYYLFGEFCFDYVLQCKNLSLVQYNLVSGVSEVLTDKSDSVFIRGFSADGDSLILSYASGDGGTIWGSYEAYTFSTNTLQFLDSYMIRYFQDSESEIAENEKIKEENENLVSNFGIFDHLVVKNGKIFSPKKLEEEGGSARVWDIMVNTTEYPVEE